MIGGRWMSAIVSACFMKPALAVARPLIQLLHQMLQISWKYHLLPKTPLLADATLPVLWAQIGSHETGKLFWELAVTHLNYVYGTSAIHWTSRLGVSRIDLGAEYPLTYSWTVGDNAQSYSIPVRYSICTVGIANSGNLTWSQPAKLLFLQQDCHFWTNTSFFYYLPFFY